MDPSLKELSPLIGPHRGAPQPFSAPVQAVRIPPRVIMQTIMERSDVPEVGRKRFAERMDKIAMNVAFAMVFVERNENEKCSSLVLRGMNVL